MPPQEKPKSYVCIHCKREFKNFKALCSHLKGCKERKLLRQFEVGGYRFDVTMNPLRRNVRALKALQEELKGANPEKAFAGALMCFKAAGYVHDFKVVKAEAQGSPASG